MPSHELAPSGNKQEPSSVDWLSEVQPRVPKSVPSFIIEGEAPGQKDMPEKIGMGVSWTRDHRGLTLVQVFPDSAAQRIGMLPNDTITAINGKQAAGLSDEDVSKLAAVEGARLKLNVDRGNDKLSFDLTVGKFKACKSSPEYESFVDATAKNYFAPSELGNIPELYHRYDCMIGSPGDAVAYARQSISAIGDPYTFVMDKKAVELESRSLSNEMVGVGVGFGSDGLSIKSVTPESPADKAGVQAGDILIAVDRQSVVGMSPAAAVHKIQGDLGKPVTLTVDRDGEHLDFVMTRDKFKFPTIEKDAGDGVEYIRSTSFMPLDATGEMRRAIERHPQAKAFVIDMRRNGGGLVENAISMAELFVPKGTLVTIERREESSPKSPRYDSTKIEVGDWFTTRSTSSTSIAGYGFSFWPREPNVIASRPVVILVDGGTASAAEMFTAAVRDNKAATVVGEKTLGKGIGQRTVMGLPGDSAVHVTMLRYFTPGNVWLGDANKNRIGITPDVLVKNKPRAVLLSKDDVQYQTALAIAKSKIH